MARRILWMLVSVMAGTTGFAQVDTTINDAVSAENYSAKTVEPGTVTFSKQKQKATRYIG